MLWAISFSLLGLVPGTIFLLLNSHVQPHFLGHSSLVIEGPSWESALTAFGIAQTMVLLVAMLIGIGAPIRDQSLLLRTTPIRSSIAFARIWRRSGHGGFPLMGGLMSCLLLPALAQRIDTGGAAGLAGEQTWVVVPLVLACYASAYLLALLDFAVSLRLSLDPRRVPSVGWCLSTLGVAILFLGVRLVEHVGPCLLSRANLPSPWDATIATFLFTILPPLWPIRAFEQFYGGDWVGALRCGFASILAVVLLRHFASRVIGNAIADAADWAENASRERKAATPAGRSARVECSFARGLSRDSMLVARTLGACPSDYPPRLRRFLVQMALGSTLLAGGIRLAGLAPTVPHDCDGVEALIGCVAFVAIVIGQILDGAVGKRLSFAGRLIKRPVAGAGVHRAALSYLLPFHATMPIPARTLIRGGGAYWAAKVPRVVLPLGVVAWLVAWSLGMRIAAWDILEATPFWALGFIALGYVGSWLSTIGHRIRSRWLARPLWRRVLWFAAFEAAVPLGGLGILFALHHWPLSGWSMIAAGAIAALVTVAGAASVVVGVTLLVRFSMRVDALEGYDWFR